MQPCSQKFKKQRLYPTFGELDASMGNDIVLVAKNWKIYFYMIWIYMIMYIGHID